MCSLCGLPVSENHNFWQILTFWGLLYRLPFTDEGNIWCAKADQTSNFISVCSFCRLPVAKTHNFWQILTFGGVSIGLFYCPLAAKNTNLCHLWTSAFSDVDSWRQFEKVEHGCTATNLPLSNGIKIISVLHRLHGEIG